MILLWMLMATAVTAIIGAAALALERAALVLRRPTRLPWVAALIFSTVWPAWRLVRDAGPHPPIGAGIGGVAWLAPVLVSAGRDAITIVAHHLGPIDGRASLIVLGTWLLATMALLTRLLLGMLSLNRERRRWVARTVDGVPVLMTPMIGPAVVGLQRPTIVLPGWALALDPPLRHLVLRHELEHVRARDTVLRLIGALVPALLPWNIALWWQADRLTLAVEADCDARVLRAGAQRERYGLLLIAIAQRQSTAILAPALSEPTSHLERRITAMQRAVPRRPALVAAGFSVAAAVALVIACSAPSPNAPSSAQPNASRATAATSSRAADQAGAYVDFRIDKQAKAYPDNPHPVYPAALEKAGVAGEVLAQFVIDTTGYVDMTTFKVVRTDNAQFASSLQSALPKMRFYPAEVGGRKVKELIEQPYAFTLDR